MKNTVGMKIFLPVFGTRLHLLVVAGWVSNFPLFFYFLSILIGGHGRKKLCTYHDPTARPRLGWF